MKPGNAGGILSAIAGAIMGRRTVWLLAVAVAAAACDGAVSPDPEPDVPTITVAGVEDGGEYVDPVTIEIAVEGGSWEAQLNEERIGSTHTVVTPGEYELVVTARDGIEEVREEVAFQIILEGDSQLIVRMIDLGDNPLGGGGDAILLSDSSAAGVAHVLVDAGTGPSTGGVNGNTNFVSQRLEDLGVDTLAALLLTHAHADHYFGMTAVLRDVHVQRFVYNGQARSSSQYRNLLEYAAEHADSMIVVDSTREYTLGAGLDDGTRLVILSPLPDYIGERTSDGTRLNEGSLGTFVERGDFELFLTGDGEREANRRWWTDYPEYTSSVDVLKVGHHGANNAIFDSGISGPSTWIDHTDPDVALISANGRTHPRINALNALRSHPGLEIFCTNVHGTVQVRVAPSGESYVVAERNRDSRCRAGSDATS